MELVALTLGAVLWFARLGLLFFAGYSFLFAQNLVRRMIIQNSRTRAQNWQFSKWRHLARLAAIIAFVFVAGLGGAVLESVRKIPSVGERIPSFESIDQ